MQIKDIIKGIEAEVIGDVALKVGDVQFDSRKVRRGSLFVAQRGTIVDGHNYIGAAVAQGAAAVVCEELTAEVPADVVVVKVKDSSLALGQIAANYYGRPSERLALVGITGTNGKTTTVTLLHRLFRNLGYHVGLISTIINKIDEAEVATSHTTPDALELNRLLAAMVDAGCQYCFMEVSSHAVVQKRIAGLHFAGAIFSNITHDHLDFHRTMANYIAAKKGFFDMLPKEAWALTNVDDRNGKVMVQNCKAKVMTYALQREADFRCKLIENTFQGMYLNVQGSEVWCRLVGRFNAYNLMAIYGAAVMCGADKAEVLRQLSLLEPAPGRFQYIGDGKVVGIVDYAHTPDALLNVLTTIDEVRQKSQSIITVVGCGGDRDRTKRPEMAKIAAEGSDKVVLTTDNPRSEEPDAILNDMEQGLSAQQKCRAVRITDRRKAIRTACMMAHDGDIVLVAGKGHEKYQEVKGVRSHFDDVEELGAALAEREASKNDN